MHAQKRKDYFISNILVNGRVRLLKFGLHVHKFIEDATSDSFDPFDPVTGADFLLQVARRNRPYFSGSTFLEPSSIGNDDVIAATLAKCKPLGEIIARTQFKPYAVLKLKYEQMMRAA